MDREKLQKCIEEDATYEGITGNDLWLENKWNDQLSRYATGAETTVWVCHACREVNVDSEEHECKVSTSASK